MIKNRRENTAFLNYLVSRVKDKLKNVWGYYPVVVLKIQIGYFLHLKTYNLNDSIWTNSFEFCPDRINLRSLYQFVRLKISLSTKHRLNLKHYLHNKVLLFGYVEHEGKNHENKSVNLYTDSYKQSLQNVGIETKELYLTSRNNTVRKNKLYFLYQLILRFEQLSLQIRSVCNFNRENRKAFTNATLVRNELEVNNFEHANQIASIFYETQRFQYIQYKVFIRFLRILKPKAIWTYCYYDNNVMALIRAAKLLNIPLTEYQHSSISNDHFAYSNWDGIDDYQEFFPQKMWVWGLEEKELIKKNFFGNSFKPEIIMGGNLSLRNAENHIRVEELSDTSKTSVLISLQGIWMPEFLQNYIENDFDFLWYIRLHPRYQSDSKKLEHFSKLFPDKVIPQKSNEISLHEVSKKVKYNITSFSGTALEVAELGVQNIIVGEDGYNAYKEKIENDIFYFANDEVSLKKALSKPANFKKSLLDDDAIFQEKILSTLRN